MAGVLAKCEPNGGFATQLQPGRELRVECGGAEGGILLGIDGLAYLAYGFADILAPGFAAHLVPWIQLPAIGELVLALWLLVAGVNTERWMGASGSASVQLRARVK